MTLDRDALIEAMAEADFMLDRPDARMPDFVRDRYIDGAAAVLPVAVRAILAPLRALHPSRACGCDDPDCPLTCRECLQVHPCPTARLIDAIEADLIGDTE